jgi:hypothetical protein
MILLIIKLAQAQKWYGVSDIVETAKGRQQYIQTWKQGKQQIKRALKSWPKK